MKWLGCILVCGSLLLGKSAAAELSELRLLYIGDIGSPREKAFTSFLRDHAAEVKTAPRGETAPAEASRVDVVLLDWPQSGFAREQRKSSSPLGERGQWTKPTLLLGSAGLNLAVVWKVRAGSG